MSTSDESGRHEQNAEPDYAFGAGAVDDGAVDDGAVDDSAVDDGVGDDRVGDEADTGKAPEPVAISQAISAILLAGVTAGWFTLNNPIVNIVLTVIGVAGSVAATITARGAVKAIR